MCRCIVGKEAVCVEVPLQTLIQLVVVGNICPTEGKVVFAFFNIMQPHDADGAAALFPHEVEDMDGVVVIGEVGEYAAGKDGVVFLIDADGVRLAGV